ncbi:MAG: NAD-dependent epimerase/dehydratase family protein [Bacillota bacterium]
MKKVLITGGAGFIGSHITEELLNNSREVIIIDNFSNAAVTKKYLEQHTKLYCMDITDKKIIDVFHEEKPEAVIHLAAQVDVNKSMEDPLFDAKVNISGTINLLEAAVKSRVEKFIFASSAAVYGNPLYLGVDEIHEINPVSFYGVSKYAAESYIKTYSSLYNISYSILRYANVYGPGQQNSPYSGVISIFINNLLKNRPPYIFGKGDQKRDFIYVKDVVRANLLSLESSENCILNIGTGKTTAINELYNLVSSLTSSGLRPVYSDERFGDIYESYFNCRLAKDLLRWEAESSLEKGLLETINYYKNITNGT